MIQKGNRILITGITGVVGSSLALCALQNDCRIVALMRDPSLNQARNRLRNILHPAVESSDFLQRIDIVLGDLCRPELGIISGATHLQNIDGIIHCAAEIDFQNGSRSHVYEVNLKGTQRIIELADCLYVPLAYISTAYVCGNRTGLIKEQNLCQGQMFNNAYEESKCQAEMYVRCWSQQNQQLVFILRPSILVGNSQTGRISCFNTVYQFMQVFESLSRRGNPITLRLPADPDSILNLLPVDCFTQTAWALLQAGQPNVYHVTHPQGITMGGLGKIFEKIFPCIRIEFFDKSLPNSSLSREEIFLRKAISHYLPYMERGPLFDLSNTLKTNPKFTINAPALDLPLFQRLHRYASEAHYGKPVVPKLERSAVSSPFVQKYFQHFLTQKLHQRLLPNLRKLSAQFRIVLLESPLQHWVLCIEEGKLTHISQNGLPPQCTFRLSESTFLDIVSGQLSPQYAFFQRMIEIDGDMEKGLSLAAVLSDFFVQHPFMEGGFQQ